MFRVTGSLQPKNGILHTVLVATEIKEDGKSIRSAPIWKTTKLPEKGGKRQAKSLLLQRISELEQSLNTLPTENIPQVSERPGSEKILSSAFVSSKLGKISPQASDEADDPQNPYFSDYMKMWLQIMKNTVQTTTYGSYQYYRHSCASLLLANGVSLKEIQEWLGHSNYATTADIYSHLEYKSKISSASTVDQKLRVGDKYQILAAGE